jgi:hypothetical protein
MENIRINVKSEEHSKIVQSMLFAMGCRWGHDKILVTPYHTASPYLYVENKTITHGTTESIFTNNDRYTYVNLDWAKTIPRTITLDGKDIEISEESYQAFKRQFQ